MTQTYYAIFDHEGIPLPSSFRYCRKNSIATMEAKEWELRKSQGWKCEKVEIELTVLTK